MNGLRFDFLGAGDVSSAEPARRHRECEVDSRDFGGMSSIAFTEIGAVRRSRAIIATFVLTTMLPFHGTIVSERPGSPPPRRSGVRQSSQPLDHHRRRSWCFDPGNRR